MSSPKWSVNRMLGKGGYASVYTTTREGQEYAIKVVNKATLTTPKKRKCIVRELRVHRGLDHANIVKFHECIYTPREIGIVLELCQDSSLFDLLKSTLLAGMVFEERVVRGVARDLGRALVYLESVGIVHCDVKCGNMLRGLAGGDNAPWKLCDFGLAVKVGKDEPFVVRGTPNYISPEAIDKKPAAPSRDWWGMGVVLYTVMTLKTPFDRFPTDTKWQVFERIRAGDWYWPDETGEKFSPTLLKVVEGFMCVDYNQRARPDSVSVLDLAVEH